MSLKSPFSSLPLSPLWREIVLFFLPPVRVTTRARLRPRQPRPLQPRPRQPRPRKAARVCVPTAAAAAEGTPARLPCPRHPRDDKAQFGDANRRRWRWPGWQAHSCVRILHALMSDRVSP